MECIQTNPNRLCNIHNKICKLICVQKNCQNSPLICGSCLQENSIHTSQNNQNHKSQKLQPILDKLESLRNSYSDMALKLYKQIDIYYIQLRSTVNKEIDRCQNELKQFVNKHIFQQITNNQKQLNILQKIYSQNFSELKTKQILNILNKISKTDPQEGNIIYTNLKTCFSFLKQNKFIQTTFNKMVKSDKRLSRLLMRQYQQISQLNNQNLADFFSIPTESSVIIQQKKQQVIPLSGHLDWRDCGKCYFYLMKYSQPTFGSQSKYIQIAKKFGKKVIQRNHPGQGGSFNIYSQNDQIYKSAVKITRQIREKLKIKDIYNDLLILHGAPQGWAFNAQEGSMHAFGGPQGRGFAYCRGGEKIKKKYHLYVYN